jgi:hypothetical protein
VQHWFIMQLTGLLGLGVVTLSEVISAGVDNNGALQY